MAICKNCKVHGVRNDEDGSICCPSCGRVLEFNNFIDEPTFEKGPQGQSRLAGSYIKSVESCYTDSYENTIRRGSEEIASMGHRLGIGIDVIGEATRYHKLALSVDFTKGRLRSLVTASCLYIACRMNKKPYLLIDFAQDLGVSVYMVGDVFLKLCRKLRLDEQTYFAINLVDPVLFIPRFMECIVKDRHIGQQQKVDMRKTAERILASMKRDWMQTGRKPSGLCGAALYISALSIGLKCTKSDIAGVVHMCEDTLTKRLIEFEDTESGSMTIYELNQKDDENKKLKVLKPISGDTETELLCKHKAAQKGESPPPHFANGLCETCYREFIEVSGGCQGGSDPPAFQRSERIRMGNVSEICDLPVRQQNSVGLQSTANGHQANVDMSNVQEDESENLSDIEVDEYLHDEEETRLKTKLWETLNKEYMEEQAAKEKAAKDRQAYEAKFQNGSVDLLGAKELAEAAAANVAKSRKELRQKRAAEVKNAGPAQTAAEAARRMLTRKRLSSKINYDLLDELFQSSKGKDIETDSNFSDIQQHKKGKIEHESDVVYNEDDYNDLRQEDEFAEEENAGAMYGDDFYQGYQEDENYGFEDYGNEGYEGYQ
ncbi:Transcription factor iiib subunit [Thalictrum thalictroides]|uniref:Transcription factor iiib subunit n=1 Tax=Thalictrum thalictroides TaxID=46969 RepID=A0A7J6W5Z5_THATH|nr:Transcription factor iiib subunit [Thalictrum thalictroides]